MRREIGYINLYGSSPKELAMIEGFKGPRVQGFKGKQ
jgi:hypothetical protein